MGSLSPIFARFRFVWGWTTKNTMDKLKALRSKSEGFCEVLEVPTIMFEDEGKELQV